MGANQHLHTQIVLGALEQALWAHDKPSGVTHRSDRGSLYLSIHYTERLAEAGFKASVGSVGGSYDNALSESINGLYKAEVIHKQGPSKGVSDVEVATLQWVSWFNHRRLLQPIGLLLNMKCCIINKTSLQRHDSNKILSDEPGGIQIHEINR